MVAGLFEAEINGHGVAALNEKWQGGGDERWKRERGRERRGGSV